LTIRCRSALRWVTSGAVWVVIVDSSGGHSPPVTQGAQSAGVLKTGMAIDSRAARRRRCRAVFRPKIATTEDYRHGRVAKSPRVLASVQPTRC
jgi:hypothetical protein